MGYQRMYVVSKCRLDAKALKHADTGVVYNGGTYLG